MTPSQHIENKIVEWQGKTIGSHEQFITELRKTLTSTSLATIENVREESKKLKNGRILVLGVPKHPDRINKTISKHKTEGYDKALSDILSTLTELEKELLAKE